MSAQLRQFNSLPSVQNIDPVLSQRVDAAFGVNASTLINFIVRIDANGRVYYWTPKGEQLGKGEATYNDAGIGGNGRANRANINQIRIVQGWINSQPSHRAL